MTNKKRFSLLALLLLISMLYFPLNHLLTDGYNLKIILDEYIPIVPEFIIPYMLFLPFWGAAFLLATWKMNDRLFRAFMAGSIAATTVATVIYFFFPTYTERPLVEVSGWASALLHALYSNDNVFNAFPSGHVLFTTLIAFFGAAWQPRWNMWLQGSVVLVVLSTLLTGQHHIIDPIGGLALGWCGYRFGLWTEYGRGKILSLAAK
jgi:membrane-associated phospholipid phosphatase